MRTLIIPICCLLLIFVKTTIVSASTVNLPIFRPNGRFAHNRPCNLTLLTEILASTELRYSSSYRKSEKNKLVRKWKAAVGVVDDEHLTESIGGAGSWYASISVGSPSQQLEFDLDMLGADFYAVMTTAEGGSRYNTFASQSHEGSNDFDHPLCKRSSDLFTLDRLLQPRLVLPICTPPKVSTLTLLSSGNALGLGSPDHSSRIAVSNFLQQLQHQGLVSSPLWSITLLDAETGVLSFGGAPVRDAEEAKIRAEIELQHFGQPGASPEWIFGEVANRLKLSFPEESTVIDAFKWTSVQGAAGWWSTMMSGVWVNGRKVLRNQPVVLDVQCPFILAPPAAAAQFYASIGGSFRLPSPYDTFFAVPCLNKVNIAFEIAGWTFPVMSAETTRFDSLHGPAGGRFSLGKIDDGTGYCIGAVVETKMRQHERWSDSGMQATWVLGEPFFRGLGVLFDTQHERIGIRSY